MTNDLRSFINLLKDKSPEDVLIINKKEVDPRLEVTAILSKLERDNRYPLLYFEKVKGSNIPIVTNMCVGYKRLGITMGFEDAFKYRNYFSYNDDLAEEYFRRKSNPIQPKKVDDGSVHLLSIVTRIFPKWAFVASHTGKQITLNHNFCIRGNIDVVCLALYQRYRFLHVRPCK